MKYIYICMYKGKKILVESDTIYRAQIEAARILKAKHSYDVNIALYSIDDIQIDTIATM